MKAIPHIALLALMSGCSILPRIKLPNGATVTAPRDAGKPATLTSGEVRTGFRVPAHSKLTVTAIEALPASDKEPAQAAREISVWEFAEPTQFERVATSLSADTGTVDTSVAKHRIDAAQRVWLLWAAIGCGVGGILAMQLVSAWPSLGRGLLAASAAAFAAWKMSEVPAWLWGAVIVVVILVILGYKRAEADKPPTP